MERGSDDCADAAFVEKYAAYTADLDGKHGTMESAAWLSHYSCALDDIRRAFEVALEEPALHRHAAEIAIHTGWYWLESGRADEGCALLERAVALPMGMREGAEVHRMVGMLHFARGNYNAAITHAQEALERGLEIEPPEPAHRYYTLYANALLYAGRYDEAEQYYRMAIDSAQSWNLPGDVSTCRFNLAILMYECKGDFAAARRLLALSFETKAPDEFDEALEQETLARIAFLERAFSDAAAHAQQALELLARVGNAEHMREVAMRRCVYLALDEKIEEARALWQKYGAQALRSENPEVCSVALEALASLLTASGDLTAAVQTRAFLERFREAHHVLVFPVEQRFYDAWNFAARSVLGKSAYERAVSDAAALRIDELAAVG